MLITDRKVCLTFAVRGEERPLGNRLASLAMLCRGMRLCGQPFAMSADASWQQMKVEYLHLGSRPDDLKTGWTDAANAPNSDVYMKVRG